MPATSSRSPRISAPEAGSGEGGFTLIELVLTVALLTVVMGGLLTVFESVQRSATFVQERSETLDEMRVALDQMTKEIRQAEEVKTTSTASRLEMTTYVLGTKQSIVYEVVSGTLKRTMGSAAAAPIQKNVASTSLFTYTVDAGGVIQLVKLDLEVHPVRRPDTTVLLTSEVRLRNEVPAA
jgi:type II secretory pathway component PulJ